MEIYGQKNLYGNILNLKDKLTWTNRTKKTTFNEMTNLINQNTQYDDHKLPNTSMTLNSWALANLSKFKHTIL